MPKKKIKNHDNDYDRNNVYMFHNTKYDFHLQTNADGWEQAMMKFDICDFADRDDWRIYVQCGSQPTRSR